MRTITTICLCILIAGCASSRIAPLEIAPVRLAIEQALQTVNTGIVTEDEILAAQMVHDRFKMDNNISLRYRDQVWGDVRGPNEFRKFYNQVFDIHANIYHTLVLTDLELTGDIATASVSVVFNSTRSDKLPPEGFAAEGEDHFIFQRDAGTWLLIAWDEAPEPIPDEGEPGDPEDPEEPEDPEKPEE